MPNLQMPKERLYFIAIIPPDKVSAEVTAFKEDMRDNYNSKKALKIIPHITLKAPFKLPAQESERVSIWFEKIPASAGPFTVSLKGFGSFDNKHNKVIYVQPLVNAEMIALQKTIVTDFQEAFPNISLSANETVFKPHMTIAYRDLSDDNYNKAWPVYKDMEYNAEFTCNSFYLLQHNGQRWEVLKEHCLGL